MQKKIALALALAAFVSFTGHAFAAETAAPAVSTVQTSTVRNQDIGDFLEMLTPGWQAQVSCPAPYCVTNQDCINRPVGDPSSTCRYGVPGTPAGCGRCYY